MLLHLKSVLSVLSVLSVVNRLRISNRYNQVYDINITPTSGIKMQLMTIFNRVGKYKRVVYSEALTHRLGTLVG